MTTLPSPLTIDHVSDLLRIRLIDPPPQLELAVERTLGSRAESSAPGRAADLTLRFVTGLGDEPLELIGRDDAAWSKDAFYLLADGRPVAEIPFDLLAAGCEIQLDRKAQRVPLLVELLTVAALSRELAVIAGTGADVGATRWLIGGPSPAAPAVALELGARARRVRNGWLLLRGGVHTTEGLRQPLRLAGSRTSWLRHRSVVPGGAPMIVARRVAERFAASRGATGRRPVAPLVDRLRPTAARFGTLTVPLDRLPADPARGTPDRTALFVLVASEAPKPFVRRLSPAAAASRLAAWHATLRGELGARYAEFRFAFPARHNELLSSLGERERQLLARQLTGPVLYLVEHPQEIPTRDLVALLSGLVAR